MARIRNWFLVGGLLWAVIITVSPGYSQTAPGDPGAVMTPDPDAPPMPRGHTSLSNPASGQVIAGTDGDRLAAFARRPLYDYIIPEGGLYLDPLHEGPHYGIDYANPDDYLASQPTYFYPIGPGYVTARSSCVMCFVDSDRQGQVNSNAAPYNFGWGALVLVETPYSPDVSVYVLYAHINRDFVSLGDYVTPDDVIGVVGTTGYSQEPHLHMEIRYGTPGRFWNADFSQQETLERWLSTLFADPARLIFPENHWAFALELDEWAAHQLPSPPIP